MSSQTYTSQASTKRGNRKSEILLREVELFSTLASLNSDYEYPKEASHSAMFQASVAEIDVC